MTAVLPSSLPRSHRALSARSSSMRRGGRVAPMRESGVLSSRATGVALLPFSNRTPDGSRHPVPHPPVPRRSVASSALLPALPLAPSHRPPPAPRRGHASPSPLTLAIRSPSNTMLSSSVRLSGGMHARSFLLGIAPVPLGFKLLAPLPPARGRPSHPPLPPLRSEARRCRGASPSFAWRRLPAPLSAFLPACGVLRLGV